MAKVGVAILGASGLVSQRMQQRIAMHQWFELVAVAGQSADTLLSDLDWHLDEPRPQSIEESELRIIDIHSEQLANALVDRNVRIAFSALPSQPALKIEKCLVDAGIHIFSNASAYRMHPNVPLIVADVNPEALIAPSDGGALHACATNCTLIPVLHPLFLLAQKHTIQKVVVRSEQALSGAGWKLLLDDKLRTKAIGNEIEGEAEKIVEEAEKILRIDGIEWDVQCKRVDERDGHIVNVDVHVEDSPTYEEIHKLLSNGFSEHLPQLPSQPEIPMIVVQSEPTRQAFLWNGQTMESIDPSSDLKAGMTTTVQLIDVVEGRISFRALSHNTIRGAAGGVLLLAELAYQNKIISSVDINPPSSSSVS
jgi:aspartate-semialdehyde dehydrogenase